MVLIKQDMVEITAQANYLRSQGYEVIIVGDDKGLAVKIVKQPYISLAA